MTYICGGSKDFSGTNLLCQAAELQVNTSNELYSFQWEAGIISSMNSFVKPTFPTWHYQQRCFTLRACQGAGGILGHTVSGNLYCSSAVLACQLKDGAKFLSSNLCAFWKVTERLSVWMRPKDTKQLISGQPSFSLMLWSPHFPSPKPTCAAL